MSYLNYDFTRGYLLTRLRNHYQDVFEIQTGIEANMLFLCENRKNSIANFFNIKEQTYFFWKHEKIAWLTGGEVFGIYGARGIARTVNADLAGKWIIGKHANILWSANNMILAISYKIWKDKSKIVQQESNGEEVFVVLESNCMNLDTFLTLTA